jgi:hypothetical protein
VDILQIVKYAACSLAVYLVSLAAHLLFFSSSSSKPGPWHYAFSDVQYASALGDCGVVCSIELTPSSGDMVPWCESAPKKVIFLDPTAMRKVDGSADKVWKKTFWVAVLLQAQL